MKLSKNFNIFLLLVLILSAIAHFRWLSFAVFQYGDWRFYFAEVSKVFLDFSVWGPNFNLGQVNYTLWRLPFNFIYGAFGSLGFDSNITDKYLVLWPAILLPPLASFFLVRQVVRTNSAAFAGALVYSFNSYFFSINSAGHVMLTVAAAFSVIFIWLFMKAVAQKNLSLYLTAGLLLSLSVIYDIRMSYIAIAVSILYWLYYVTLSSQRLEVMRSMAAGIGILVSIAVLLNSYWLLPAMAGESLLSNEIMQRGLFGNQFMNILRALALFHPFWNGAKPEWFVVQPIPWYFFSVPILAFWGLLQYKGNKDILFFGLLSLIGILLAKQSGEPYTRLYLFLFTNVPGFAAFREASKFYFPIAMGYAVLVGALVSWLHYNPLDARYAIFSKYLVVLVVLSVSMWNAKPLITGELGTMFVERHVPDDYERLKQHIFTDREYSRVLWVPTDTPWEVNNDKHPTVSIAGMIYADWGKMFSSQSSEQNLKVEEVIQLSLSQSYSQRLLENSSIRYIIVPLRDTANDGDFYQYYGGSKDAFIKQLDRLDFLRRLNIGMTDAVAFKNINARPHIYLTSEMETIYNFVPYHPIEFNAKRQTEYRIHVKNLSSPVYLHFTDNYHPDWRLYSGSFSWWNALKSNPPNSLNSSHIKSDAGLNSFYIDPAYIKRMFSKDAYKENTDGSIDIELTLYFKTQAYLNLGLIISILTLAGCLSFLLIVCLSRIRGKYSREYSMISL